MEEKVIVIMKEIPEQETAHSHLESAANTKATECAPQQQETTSRRALIQKYGKYAAVGAPLLLFTSKAHAIHSRP